jgi:hypothetical protein
MSTTTTGPAAAILVEPEAGPEKLLFTLLDGSVVELELRGWNVDVAIESVFRRGHLRASDGVYYAASQIKKIVAK